ncbi:MBL fold metallo-hydrolase [Anaeromyxobacter sp. Fw109-5]|uniref:MBL fold metallo-hydrolase n=1 Tax=Anaeromyxobacter sp. (strain Fw109-5) TaxID=404589 RepID=UPI0000ED7810|nr:MBL fold metallo-hydrolase [Anaeromyxobacter sp. Fw109-5]ABS24777.1 beta-lactamase domain protein [Anaeromyxobacter sp. Fw109-5]
MSALRLVPLGVGDAFSAERYSTCLALGAGDRWLLVDCPHPIRKMMREASLRSGLELDVDRVEAVALTHLHADHASGLEGLAYFSHFALGRRARVAAHPEVARRLWDGHLAAGMEQVALGSGAPVSARLEDFFELVPLDERGAVRVGPFEIECRFTRHPLPTTAFRIAAGGRRVACSADTAFDPALVAWLAEADLVVHEAGFGIHTPLERLAALPPELRARLRLAHFPDQLDLSACGIEPLEQGRAYDV